MVLHDPHQASPAGPPALDRVLALRGAACLAALIGFVVTSLRGAPVPAYTQLGAAAAVVIAPSSW